MGGFCGEIAWGPCRHGGEVTLVCLRGRQVIIFSLGKKSPGVGISFHFGLLPSAEDDGRSRFGMLRVRVMVTGS
jgi:hypothetical protein